MQVDIITAAGRIITAEDSDHLAELLESQAGDCELKAHGELAEVVAFDAIMRAWPDAVAAWDTAEGIGDDQAVLIEHALEDQHYNPGGDLAEFLDDLQDGYRIMSGNPTDWAAGEVENESGGSNSLPGWARPIYSEILEALADQAERDGYIRAVNHDLGDFVIEMF